MADFEGFLSQRLARGKISFTREELLRALSAGSSTLTASLSKLARKGRIANPRPGFYLILTDERVPDPARWIHALMKHQKTDYRISLLCAAKFHGATPEPQALQLIVPKPLTDFAAGAHRIEFLAQAPNVFERLNRSEWLAEWKTDTGAAKAAGIELTLLDCTRWFHKAGGISALQEILRELGAKARPARLAALARDCENSAVMRLGYLLERAGHEDQAKALDAFSAKAKVKLLDPTSQLSASEMSGRWKIAVNTPPKR